MDQESPSPTTSSRRGSQSKIKSLSQKGKLKAKNDSSSNNIEKEKELSISNEDPLDAFLHERGFAPISRVRTIHKTTGKEYLKYVIAWDPLGNTSYIEIDDIDRLFGSLDISRSTARELSTFEYEAVTKNPTKVILTASRCSKLEVCGTAYECEGGICTVKRNPKTLDTEETIIAITSDEDVRHAVEFSRGVIAFPIVKLSEIAANPRSVVQHIDSATKRIRNEEINKHNQIIDKLSKSLQRFNQVNKTLLLGMRLAHDNINKVESNLMESQRSIRQDPISEVGPPQGKEMMKDMEYDIANRLHLVDEHRQSLFRYSSLLHEYRTTIDDLTVNMTNMFESIKLKYS